jgi:hypothetical protein
MRIGVSLSHGNDARGAAGTANGSMAFEWFLGFYRPLRPREFGGA